MKDIELTQAQMDILYKEGAMLEHKRIIKMLEDYFEMTQEPNDEGKVEDNPEWDRGFQAAIALVRNNPK